MILRILAFSRASRFLFVPLFAAWLCFPAQAKRKDLVVMNNGDHFTGEVKRLENGLLYVETDSGRFRTRCQRQPGVASETQS